VKSSQRNVYMKKNNTSYGVCTLCPNDSSRTKEEPSLINIVGG
jgi:hypothetical protein